MRLVKQFVLFIVYQVVHNEASRILAVFPTPSISHQVVFRPLVLELVKRGHEVVMLTTDPIYKKGEGPANLTEIDVHDMSYSLWRKSFLSSDVTKGSKDDLQEQAARIFTIMENVFEAQVQTAEIQAILKDKSQNFDLILLEAYFEPLLGFSHVIKAPVILVSSFGATTSNMEAVGAPLHPIQYPTCIQQKVWDFSPWEKIIEVYNDYRMERVFRRYDSSGNALVKRLFGKDAPTMYELRNNIDMLFLNLHPMWEKNRPVPPNVVYMGGVHQKPEKELPKDLKTYLNSSKHGVIYVSYGTNVDPALLPPEKIQILLNTFSKLPYDILWKWNHDELPGRSKNIKISKWLPQSDLLRHPNVKLFITQGGLQSTDEAITAGIPLIGMPMLGDQWFNVDHYVHNKIGMKVEMENLTEEAFTYAIQTIINDKSYREDMVRLRSLMRDQPQTPLERAIWWAEYVIRHGGAKHLKSPAANMHWTEYYEIRLVSYFLSAVVALTAIVLYATFYLYKLFYTQKIVSIKIKSK